MNRVAALLVTLFAAAVARAETADEDSMEATLQALLEDAQPGLHRCWEKAAADDFRLEGKITLKLTMGKGGKVKKVAVAEDGPKDKVLTKCVVDMWKKRTLPSDFAAGDTVELPLSFVSPGVQYTVRTEDAAVLKPRGGKLQATFLLDEQTVGADKASMHIIQLGGRTELTYHRHSSAEIIYVLSGQGRLYGPGVTSKRGEPFKQGDAIYVPARANHRILSTGGKNWTRLLIVYAPGGPEQLLKNSKLAKERQDLTWIDHGEADQPGQIQFKHLTAKDVRPYEIPAGRVRMYFDAENTGDGAGYLGLVTLKKDAEVAEHVHEGEAELLYITAGSGEMVVNGEKVPVQKDMAVYIPAGAKHSLRVTGGSLEAVQLYTPGGPEQRFKGEK